MADESYTVTLGNNDIVNCDAALMIEGEEVFCLREEEGRLLVDCDVLNAKGVRLAKVVRNTPIVVAPGFRVHIKPGEPTQVVSEMSGRVLASFERKGPRHVKISGVFCVNGYCVFIDETAVRTSDPSFRFSLTTVHGCGTALSLKRGQVELGFSETPPRR
jgi:hypothetical protein